MNPAAWVTNHITNQLMLVPGWQDIIDDQRKVQGQLFVKVLYRPYLEEDEGAGKRLRLRNMICFVHRHQRP